MDRSEDPDTSTALQASFDAVEATVSYLRASTEAPPDDGWLRCHELIADVDALGGLIRSTGEGRGAHDVQVAASLFVQGYAFRIPSVALAAYALGLDRPRLDPASTATKIARNRPAAVAYLDPEPGPGGSAALADELLDHLGALIAAVRAEITIGERILWGNVAASVATAFRAVEGESPDTRDAIRDAADAFFTAASPQLTGLGEFVLVDGTDRQGWFWQRSNCCLWYQTADGNKCDDCSLLEPDERLAGWRAQLAPAT
jgi:ferric iron reductase protein FhuF